MADDSAAMMDAPADTGMEAPSEQPDSSNYADTVHSAVDNIPESKYLKEPTKETKKEAPKTSKDVRQQAAAPEEEEEDLGYDAPENQEDAKKAKQQAAWTAYKQAYHELPKLKATLADYERKLAQASDNRELLQLRSALQQLHEEREQLRHVVDVGNVEQSPRWKEYVTQPLNQMWEDTQAIAKRSGLDANKMVGFMIARDDRALNEYLSEAGPMDRHHAFSMLRDLDNIERTKGYLRKNADEMYKNDQAQYTAYQQHQMHQQHQIREQAVQTIQPKIMEKAVRFIPKDKRPDMEAAVPHIRDFDNWKPNVKIYAGYAALVLPEVLDGYKAARMELKAAKEELIRMRGGTPKATSGQSRPGRSNMQVMTDEEEEAELKRPIRDYAMDAAKRIQALTGIRQQL